MHDSSQILSAALTLSEDERLSLASQLLASVAPEPELTGDQFLAELDRRCAEYDADPSVGISWEDVRAEMLARRQSGQGHSRG